MLEDSELVCEAALDEAEADDGAESDVCEEAPALEAWLDPDEEARLLEDTGVTLMEAEDEPDGPDDEPVNGVDEADDNKPDEPDEPDEVDGADEATDEAGKVEDGEPDEVLDDALDDWLDRPEDEPED